MNRKHRGWYGCLLASLTCVDVAKTQQRTPDSVLSQNLKSAAAAYDAGDYPSAVSQLEKLLSKIPKSFEVHELLGLSYAATSQDAKAVDQLQQAVQLQPDSAVAHANLATALVRRGGLQQAEREYRKAIDFGPPDYSANRNLAGIYLQTNRVAEALPYLTEAHRLNPATPDNTYDLALASLLTGNLENSRTLAIGLLAEKNSAELHSLLGQIDEKESKFLEAEKEFSTAAHMDPSEDNLFIWASELLLHRTYVPAIDVFRKATERYPNSPRLWIGLGMSLYSRGEYDDSVHALVKAADLNPNDPRCYVFLSKAYLSAPNQAEDVIARFRRYSESKPNDALAQYDYAMSLWKGKRLTSEEVDLNAVAALLQRAIALDSTLVDAHLQLGILYTDRREYDKSLPEYQRAIRLDPNLPDAHFRLGRYYLRVGDKQKSDEEFAAFKRLQAEHQSKEDKERAEVQQFVVSGRPSARTDAKQQ